MLRFQKESLLLKPSGLVVLVVGTGISGIAAMKACLEEGHHPICFEASEDIGGLWRYKQHSEFPSIYQKTCMDSPRGWNMYPDTPMNPDEYPLLLHHTDIMRYLRDNMKMYSLHALTGR